jgi:hypothetical protein
MVGELLTFRALPIGAHFFAHGNNCIKNSRMTAKLIQYDRIFYFSQTETVTLGWAGEDE